jgi:hypothetical protein
MPTLFYSQEELNTALAKQRKRMLKDRVKREILLRETLELEADLSASREFAAMLYTVVARESGQVTAKAHVQKSLVGQVFLRRKEYREYIEYEVGMVAHEPV